MKRSLVVIWMLVLVLVVACSSPPTPTDDDPQEPTVDPPPPDSQVDVPELALLDSYYFIYEANNEKDADFRQNYPALYEPFRDHLWDRLTVPWWGPYNEYTRADWLHLDLNRDAVITVVWEGDEPASWLADWEEGLEDSGRRTFSKDVKAGHVALGSMEGKGRYHVYLGEADGSSPQRPALPEGISEAPLANKRCPDWVHDTYTTTGPDGREYKTWHPQIDPRYWCYFGHDHGSDPSLAGVSAAFGYVAFNNDKQDESHEGFKGFAIQDGGVSWYINIHALTGSERRVCVDLHTVVFFAYSTVNQEKLAEIHYKGDFGETRATVRPEGFDDHPLIESEDCDMEAIAAKDSKAFKRVRVLNDERFGDHGYEVWRMADNDFLGLSFNNDVIDMDIRDPMTGCNGLSCSEMMFTGGEPDTLKHKANIRTINFHGGIKLIWQEELDPDKDGHFCTDAKGTTLIASTSDGGCPENAVRQYILPGVNIAGPTGFHVTDDAWHGLYEQGVHAPVMELEYGLQSPN